MPKAGTENENLRMARAEKSEKSARARATAAEAAAAEAERKTNMLAGTPSKEQVALLLDNSPRMDSIRRVSMSGVLQRSSNLFCPCSSVLPFPCK